MPMLDVNSAILIVPPMLTAILAYLIARKRNIINERVSKSKIDAEIQTQALTIVKGVMTDMRDELKRELQVLRDENADLKVEINNNKSKIESLENELEVGNQLIRSLKSEIQTLQHTVDLYKQENSRLKRM